MSEYWRTVVIDGVEHPRYKISNLGRVKCLDWKRTGKEMICKLYVNSEGYLVVNIDSVRRYAHRLLAEAFLPCPDPEKNCIDHIRTIRTENFVILDDKDGQTVIDSSLRWVSHKENSNNPLTRKHLSENAAWLGKFGADCPNSIPIVQLTLDGKIIRRWSSAREAQRELGIGQAHITACCKGKRKTAGGFKWIYASDYQRKSISEIKPLF